MRIFNNPARFYTQAFVVESTKAIAGLAVQAKGGVVNTTKSSAKVVKNASVASGNVLVNVAKAPVVKVQAVKAERKVASAKQNLEQSGFKFI